MLVLTVALLALIGAYSLGYFAIGSSARDVGRRPAREQPARALRSASVRLHRPRRDDARNGEVDRRDVQHGRDRTARERYGDVTIASCGSSAQCSPVQTLTGADHKSYKVETFIRTPRQPEHFDAGSEKIVTVVVRNMSASGSPRSSRCRRPSTGLSVVGYRRRSRTARQTGVQLRVVDAPNKTVVDNTTLDDRVHGRQAADTTSGHSPRPRSSTASSSSAADNELDERVAAESTSRATAASGERQPEALHDHAPAGPHRR